MEDKVASRTQLRPFYFVIVVWGEQYRNYFLEYCLPSLLSAGNIPAISNLRPAKYLIATTAEDWAAMRQTAIFRELERYTNPMFVELPAQPPDRPYWMQGIIGHKLCCDIAFADKAYRIFTGPDALYSDGMVARLHELALQGADVVLKLVSPVVGEDTFFRTLAQLKMLPSESARDTGRPLKYSGRQLATAALRSMHSMTTVNEWEAEYFCGYAATPWWRVPGEEGIVICGMSWDLLLINYAATHAHDSSVLDQRGFDGHYIMRTAGHLETFYMVQDSDEIHIVSWVSYPEYPLRRHAYGGFGKGTAFRKSFYESQYNSLHRSLMFMPTWVHSGSLTGTWDAIEERALRTLKTWVEPPNLLAQLSRGLPYVSGNYLGIEEKVAAIKLPWWRRNSAIWTVCRRFLMPAVAYWLRWGAIVPWAGLKSKFAVAHSVARLFGLILRGDRVAKQWFRWRLRKLIASALRRPFFEPRPNPPK